MASSKLDEHQSLRDLIAQVKVTLPAPEPVSKPTTPTKNKRPCVTYEDALTSQSTPDTTSSYVTAIEELLNEEDAAEGQDLEYPSFATSSASGIQQLELFAGGSDNVATKAVASGMAVKASRPSSPLRSHMPSAEHDIDDSHSSSNGFQSTAKRTFVHDSERVVAAHTAAEECGLTISQQQVGRKNSQQQNGRTSFSLLPAIDEEQFSPFNWATRDGVTPPHDTAERGLSTSNSSFSLSSDASTVVPEGFTYASVARHGGPKRSQQQHVAAPGSHTSPIDSHPPRSQSILSPSSIPSSSDSSSSLHNSEIWSTGDKRRAYHAGPRPGQLINHLLSQPLIFTYTSPHEITNCSLNSCRAPTSSFDHRTVLCPRCGELSIVRYCSTCHLHADLRRHYIQDCGRRLNSLSLIDIKTAKPLNRPRRSFINVSNATADSFERYRQATNLCYPSIGNAEYHIFDDVDLMIAGEGPDFTPTPQNLSRYRGCGKAITGVVFSDYDGQMKWRFRGLLNSLLSLGHDSGKQAPLECATFFTWIKDKLREMDAWDERMIDRVYFAMQLEFGYRVPARLWD